MTHAFVNDKRLRFFGTINKLRLIYYKAIGLKFGNKCRIGRIICAWPGNVIIGNECVVLDGVILYTEHGYRENIKIKIGDRVFLGHNVEFNSTNSITIGNDVMIAGGSKIIDVGHNYKIGELMNKQALTSHPIVIEDDVWIAANCVIIGGVVIGKGCVVAAGSVVTKSIPCYEVWGGVPAKFIKNR